MGRIVSVTNANNKITNYQYDGINRVTKVTFPDDTGDPNDNPFATLSYDDLTNTVTVTDENGGVVTEKKDWAGGLVEANQYCTYAYGSDLSVYNWTFTYDSMGNMLSQKDPKGNITDKKYDALGRLVEVDAPSAKLIDSNGESRISPVIKYEYDNMGNKIKETSANNYSTSLTYDELGRLLTTTTKADGVDSIITNKYDAAGNKTSVINNGKKWKYSYSERNFLTTETDPLGNTKIYKYDVLGNKIETTDSRGNGIDGEHIQQNTNMMILTD